MKLMEERGWGLSRMRDLLVNHGLQPPEFNYESGYFVVTFFGQEPAVGIVSISPDLRIKLNSRQKKIINLIQKRGKITSAECMKKFKIDRRTALRDLNQLLNLDIIEKKGGGPTTYYILTVSSN